MATTEALVEQLRTKLARYHTALGEQNTKAALIEPLLRGLGWDVEDVDEVHREFKARSMDNPVDYALMFDRKPVLFVEAKGTRENLEDRKWAAQIMGYAVVAGVEWVLLTNGDEYRIYNSHAAVPVEDKLFRSARLSEPSTNPEEVLDLVSRTCVVGGRITIEWKAHQVDYEVRNALAVLFAPSKPDPSLVRLIQKHTKAVTPGQVKEALDRLEVSWAGAGPAPVVPTQSVKPRLPGHRPQPVPGGRRARRRPDNGDDRGGSSDVLRRIMSARSSPLELEKTYLGNRMTARIEVDGRVTWDGKTFDSVSQAAAEARKSVIGNAPDGRLPHTNGWVFWQFRDAQGKLQPIDVLRAQSH